MICGAASKTQVEGAVSLFVICSTFVSHLLLVRGLGPFRIRHALVGNLTNSFTYQTLLLHLAGDWPLLVGRLLLKPHRTATMAILVPPPPQPRCDISPRLYTVIPHPSREC